jgi:hypothetical protein
MVGSSLFGLPSDLLQQTVDGMQRALEIPARSSYVRTSPIGVDSGTSGTCAPNAAR